MKIKLLLILCGLTLLGCASDDDAFLDFSQISVVIQEGNYLKRNADEKISLNVSLSSPEVLTSLEIFVNGQSMQTILIEAVKNRTLTLDFETYKSEAGDSKFISFLATDEAGGFGNAEVEIEVLATSLGFVQDFITLQHYHADTTQFAFDLANNGQTTDSTKADIWINSSFGAWNTGIKSFTSTQFVKVENPTEINFNAISEEAISLIYETGNPSDYLVGLSESDILIAKLRNTNSYSIIEIKQISALLGDNSETIVLKYRKATENSGQ
ncbi:MAG: hypothetical protein ACI85I_002914 [Arenicella sp.]|jgi:hypothetical protein